jgi:hypothetical protein
MQALIMMPADAGAASASSSPVVIGEEAHIVAEEDDGPRGDPTMPVSDRNAYANLMLLCPTHHTLIDKNNGRHFSVDQLHRMKAEHEVSVERRRTGATEDAHAVGARARQDALLEAASASRGRLVARWVAADVNPELAQALADDESVGASSRLAHDLPSAGLAVLEGDFGSGKSVTAERIHQADIARAADDEMSPVPVYLAAKAVAGPLVDAVLRATEGLGLPQHTGVNLVLDGLDEPGSVRGAELLYEARSLIMRWQNSRVIATARPGLSLHGNERFAYPPLSDDEATALASRLGGQGWMLESRSRAVRAMLHLPLFVIVAVLRQRAGAEVPRSQGTFLEVLANAALERTPAPTERTRAALISLARLTTAASGLVAAAELGSDEAVNLMLESRLVVRAGRALRFALPAVEQYFAARSVLEAGPEDIDLGSLKALDRWRDSLTLAVTIGSWQQVSAVLDTLAARHPGLASWLVTSAVPASMVSSDTNVPDQQECARRLRHALSAWVASLGPLGRRLNLTDTSGRLRTVGTFVEANQVYAGLRTGDNSGVDTTRLPYGLHPFTGKAPEGSSWGPLRLGNAPADFAAWPWQWGLNWVSRSLEAVLRARSLPLPDTKPYQDERRWALAKAIVAKKGSINHRPVEENELRDAATRLLASMTEHGKLLYRPGRNRRRIFHRDEIVQLVEALKAGQLSAGDEDLYHRPYPAPDVMPGHSGHVSSVYNDETLRTLAELVHANALVIYRDLVDTWFSAFAPTLGLACMLPVAFKAKLLPRAGSWDDPDFDYEMDPLPPGSPSTASVLLVAKREDLNVNWEEMLKKARKRRQLIAAFHPGAEAWAHPRAASTTLYVYGDTPATAQAYRWLWEDLRELHMVQQVPPIGED